MVFAEIYQFSTGFTKQIPSQGSQACIEGYIRGLLDLYVDSNELIIVYYEGYGGLDDEGHFLRSKNTNIDPWNPSAEVYWHKIQPILQQCRSHMLILTDARYAAGAGPYSVPSSLEHGATEVLASCGFEVM